MDISKSGIESSLYALRRLTATDFAALAWMDEGERIVRWRYASGNRNERYKRIMMRNGKGVAGSVMRSGRPLLLQAFSPQQGDVPSDYPILLAEGLRSIIGYPITIGDRVLGVLLIGNRYDHQFDPSTVELVSNVAEQFGAMLQKRDANGTHG
jgi:signal transduction protein with GAF and PtsI domain